MKRLLWFALVLGAAAPSPAEAAAPPAARAEFQKAVDAYETELRHEGVIGGSVALIDKGGIVAERDYGLRDKAAGLAADPATEWHWASVTKVFTAIAAMQLVERGKLSLDDPVVKYVPEIARIHDPFGPVDRITIRHLLTHSAGFRGPTWPWNADGDKAAPAWQRHEPQRWSQIAALMPYTALDFAPGTKTSYSNLGMSILGRVVEVVTNDSIGVYIDKNILKPLGMTHSYFNATPWLLRPERTHNYTLSDGELTDNGAEVDTGATLANGGLNGTMGDMARFVRFLLGDPRSYSILRRATLEQMLEPQMEFERDDHRIVWIGLGFFIVDDRNSSGEVRRYFGHSGFQQGHRTNIFVARDGSAAIVWAANTARRGKGNPSALTLRVQLVDKVFPLVRPASAGNLP